jgi:hypothetical protein
VSENTKTIWSGNQSGESSPQLSGEASEGGSGAMEKYMQVEVKAVPSSSSFGKIIMFFY